MLDMFLDSLLQDLRHGARLLVRNPGFTLVAVLALALGIGVNTAVFTAYQAMIRRPLDARRPKELVNLALVRPSGLAQFMFSYPDYEAYRDSARSFSGLIAFSLDRMTVSQAGDVVSQRASVAESSLGRLGLLSSGTVNAEFGSTFVVSENYFNVLGVEAIRGRTFETMAAGEAVRSPSVLISENYWQKRFNGDPAMLGKTIRLNGVPVAVIGITPHNFMGTGAAVPDFWLPMPLAPLVHGDPNWLRNRENLKLRLFGRLAPGVAARRAQAEMTILAERMRALHDPRSESARPATALAWEGSPFPLPLNMYRGVQLAILLVMAAAAMVLVVACANVGSLQLARSRARLSELHTRLSIGATRQRLIRQLLTESAVLGAVAAIVALLVTWGLLKVAVTKLADALPPEYGTLVFDVTPDLAIFSYVLMISLAASVLFGLTPAVESSRSALAESARGSTSPARSRRIQDVFVAAQVALALVLLIAGSMLTHSSMNALRMDPGYDSQHLLSVDYGFPIAAQYTPDRKAALVRDMRERLASLPGVSGIANGRAPNDSPFQTAAVSLDAGARMPDSTQTVLHYGFVQANYFETVGIPLVLGRGFQADRGPSDLSVVVSQSAARLLWPGESPVGRTLRLGPLDERTHDSRELIADGPAYQVIGVARDIRGVEFDGSNSKQVYLRLPDDRLQDYPILVRSIGDPTRLVKAIDPVLASIDRDLLATTSTLDEMLHRSAPFIVSSLSAVVSVTIGLFGLLLASMGIHGTVSYLVARRTREVGIRMALGAQKRDVLTLMLREGTRPVVIGLAAGMVLAVGASYLLRRVLYAVSTVDGVSFLGVPALFFGIALIAAFAPARRATSVDPGVALRYE
jgi:putative ABC transport system permease protein